MVSFPAIAPVYPASEGTSLPESKILLGDGYKRLLSFGLNTVKPEWRLEWLVNQSSADAIDLFLQSCADNSEFFQWQPPDSSSELNWKCEEWSVEQQAYNVYSIKATFKRIFEISMLTLSPAPEICQGEGDGFGDWEIIIPEIGSPYINSTVTAPPVLPCSGAALQWYRNGVPIVGATGSTYTLTSADAGQAITLGYDCPGDLPGGTGISTPIYPIPYPWENYDGTEIIFDTPGMFRVKFDVYSNFTVYECGTSTARTGEYVPLYRTEPGFAHPQVTGFKMVGPAVKNQTGICYSPSTSGGYAAGAPYVLIYGTWYLIINGYYGWTNDAGISWGPQGYSPEPRGIVQHLPVEMTFNGQPVYAPLPAN